MENAWSSVRVPFEYLEPNPVTEISDCVHVASEEGDYSFKKVLSVEEPSTTVCGLYIVSDPNRVVEISIKYLDASCDTGALMAFFDGWELNGKYFPNERDHHLPLEQRTHEFCNHNAEWPFRQLRKRFRSSQNAALLQYRIPVRGSFVATVKFFENPEPCNILVEGTIPFYSLSNYGAKRNCTLTSINPSVVTLRAVNIGAEHEAVNYNCDSSMDHLVIGGSKDLDSVNMQISSNVCGHTEKIGPEQAIFCEVTTVRLVSHGNYNNQLILTVRNADENDINIATLLCPM
ncbi:corticotropin-releasing factor-binding protein isoform X2 [Contarinia nasturtii]|uniref:corticotropin-releasing factor-binding protein isoform X2 n=1 Tax=Contarinia nasturtii TaxID=265458 RepID=UPI0012D43F55|nr:corticotropin-releasing factor-binding protein isoform X2 [Contarinia nasturtii]